MVRQVEASAGLALLGPARIGDLSFSTPAWLASGPSVGAPIRLEAALPSAPEPGHRRVRLVGAGGSIEVAFSIPTPEVSGVPGGWQTTGPGIAFVHWPLSDIELAALRAARPQLVILGNARVLLREGRPFISAIRDLRTAAGAGAILWAPRTALPHRIPLLTYLGVDLVDATEALLAGREGDFEPTLGTLDHGALAAEGLGQSGDPVGAPFDREVHLARAAIRAGRLRELVEARLTAEPLLAELLRYADADLGELLEERVPVTGTPTRTYVLSESLRRPEAVRFRARFLERYRPPPSKQVLLLVPCSRTKPYRNSPSHRRFARALEGPWPLHSIHVVSVTSPLGVVPRELEDVPPAKHYDIPVTGTWSEPEREWVVAAVGHMLRHGRYRRVIAHLDPDEYRFLRPLLDDGIPVDWTMTDHRSTAPEALDALRSAVGHALEEGPGPAEGPLTTVREELHEIAAFQLGRVAAGLLFAPPVRLHGRPWSQRITDGGGVDLATWQESRGLFHLTAAGGVRVAPAGVLQVQVGDGVDLKGDLFTPGVASADLGIRAGDAVVLTRNGGPVAVGEAELAGRLMQELPRGLAVSVRHRVKHAVAPTTT